MVIKVNMYMENNKFEIDEVVVVRFPSLIVKGKIIGPLKDNKYPVELIEDHQHQTGLRIISVEDIFKIKQ